MHFLPYQIFTKSCIVYIHDGLLASSLLVSVKPVCSVLPTCKCMFILVVVHALFNLDYCVIISTVRFSTALIKYTCRV